MIMLNMIQVLEPHVLMVRRIVVIVLFSKNLDIVTRKACKKIAHIHVVYAVRTFYHSISKKETFTKNINFARHLYSFVHTFIACILLIAAFISIRYIVYIVLGDFYHKVPTKVCRHLVNIAKFSFSKGHNQRGCSGCVT